MRRALLHPLLLVAVLGISPASAQFGPIDALGAGDAPLEIESDEGMELHQDRQMALAKGNVVVRQGAVTLRADIVSASYREEDGRRSIHRLDAVGNVRIVTEREKLFGDHATYDLRRELFLMTGRDVRVEGERQTVTASESLEYWGQEKRAVGRGDATVVQHSDNTKLRADVIEAQLAPKAPVAGAAAPRADDLALDQARAWGRVIITTASEIVQGDRGFYDASKKVATLEGRVQITRGRNQLNGDRAVVDMETGVSRLTAAPGERVRSIFYPGSQNAEAPPPQERRPGTENARPRPRPPGAP